MLTSSVNLIRIIRGKILESSIISYIEKKDLETLHKHASVPSSNKGGPSFGQPICSPRKLLALLLRMTKIHSVIDI